MQVIKRPSLGFLRGSVIANRQRPPTRKSNLTSKPEAAPSLKEQLRTAATYVRPDVRDELGSLLVVDELETAKDRLLDYVLAEHETYEEVAWFEEKRADYSTIDRKLRWTIMTQWAYCMSLLAIYVLA